jgi:hypothetical protein
VRFYDATKLVKTHPRVGPGERHTDPADFPPEKAACARRDRAFFERQAAQHGVHIGRFAERLLAGPLPWTRMRQVFALLGLVRRYGAARLEAACQLALEADMTNVHRLRRLLDAAPQVSSPSPSGCVVPIARYLRPAEQYRLALNPSLRTEKGEPA